MKNRYSKIFSQFESEVRKRGLYGFLPKFSIKQKVVSILFCGVIFLFCLVLDSYFVTKYNLYWKNTLGWLSIFQEPYFFLANFRLFKLSQLQFTLSLIFFPPLLALIILEERIRSQKFWVSLLGPLYGSLYGHISLGILGLLGPAQWLVLQLGGLAEVTLSPTEMFCLNFFLLIPAIILFSPLAALFGWGIYFSSRKFLAKIYGGVVQEKAFADVLIAFFKTQIYGRSNFNTSLSRDKATTYNRTPDPKGKTEPTQIIIQQAFDNRQINVSTQTSVYQTSDPTKEGKSKGEKGPGNAKYSGHFPKVHNWARLELYERRKGQIRVNYENESSPDLTKEDLGAKREKSKDWEILLFLVKNEQINVDHRLFKADAKEKFNSSVWISGLNKKLKRVFRNKENPISITGDKKEYQRAWGRTHFNSD